MGDENGNFFKRRRNELGLSQFAMAIRMGCTPASVSLWDRSLLVPGKPIAKLAEAYQATIEDVENGLLEIRRAIEAADVQAVVATAAK